uniref:Uncharacterized protein n=1 Tax=Alexandrium monilatum TaxID=311494 RepID=A0A7S4RMC6_9DINO
MAPRRSGALLRCCALAVAAVCAARLLGASRGLAAAGPAAWPAAARPSSAPSSVSRRAGEAGKVNIAQKQEVRDYLLGEDGGPSPGSSAPPAASEDRAELPTLECDEACVTAIEDCLEEGCSVEAIQKLDESLAKDEAKVMGELRKAQSAWLLNFLQRTGALRAQLSAILRSETAASCGEQLVRAAAVAFGGSRPTDYPKSGVSPYSG